jgi:hypothetical protein
MIIEQAIHDELLDTSAVTALVGQNIFYVKAPQDVVAPYVVITKITSPRSHTHDGADGLCETLMQISIFTQTYYEGKQIAVQVQAVLDSYQGTMGGDSGVIVNSCFYENEVDLYEEGQELHHLACDYRIRHDD